MRHPLAIIALNSWEENLRSRFFLVALAFGGIILYLSLLLGLLAADQEIRVLLDTGLAFIELIGLAGAIYGAATSILREMETKTVYLILTRPVGRAQYLLGRFLGLMLSVAASMSLMAVFHVIILLSKGWHPEGAYVLALLAAYLKVLITAALATFLALFSTSTLTALTITLILWTLGHVLPEIRFLIAHKARHAHTLPLLGLAYVLPNLQLFNFRDRLDAVSIAAPEHSLLVWLGYAAAYAGAWLAASALLFRKKEF
jgi:Cu-processing system permease protein